MGAPTLIDINASDPIDIALEELLRDVIPITIKRHGVRR